MVSAAPKSDLAVSERYLAWTDLVNGKGTVCLYELAGNKEKCMEAGQAPQGFAALASDYLVWKDERNDSCDIYLYDIANAVDPEEGGAVVAVGLRQPRGLRGQPQR